MDWESYVEMLLQTEIPNSELTTAHIRFQHYNTFSSAYIVRIGDSQRALVP